MSLELENDCPVFLPKPDVDPVSFQAGVSLDDSHDSIYGTKTGLQASHPPIPGLRLRFSQHLCVCCTRELFRCLKTSVLPCPSLLSSVSFWFTCCSVTGAGRGGELPSAATVSLRHSLSLSISFSGHRELHLTFNPLKYNSVGFGPFL